MTCLPDIDLRARVLQKHFYRWQKIRTEYIRFHPSGRHFDFGAVLLRDQMRGLQFRELLAGAIALY